MCTFSHLHPYNILQVREGEEEMGAGAGFLHVTDTANTFFFSLFLRLSGCCISYMRTFQDPSLVITYSNSYICPDETIFLDMFLLVLLNVYFDMSLLAQLQHKTVDVLENKDINISGLSQTARLLKKRNYHCFWTTRFLGNMTPCVQYYTEVYWVSNNLSLSV